MALAGCRILVLGDQRLPADHHRLGGTLSLNGAPALPAWTLTHIVADGWAAVTARAPSLARRHHPAQPDGPPPRGSAQLVFVRPRWLEECLRTGRRAAEGPHAFAAGDEEGRRRGSGDDEGRPRQLRRTEAVQSAPDAARAAARPAVPMALPASASRTFNHRHGATLDCRQLTPSRGWRIAEQELGVWVSDPPPLLRTSSPQPVAAFDFDNTLATCNNQAGGPQDWEFRKDVRSGADMGVRESLRWLHQQGYLIVVMSNNSVNSLKNVEGKSGIHAKLAQVWKDRESRGGGGRSSAGSGGRGWQQREDEHVPILQAQHRDVGLALPDRRPHHRRSDLPIEQLLRGRLRRPSGRAERRGAER